MNYKKVDLLKGSVSKEHGDYLNKLADDIVRFFKNEQLKILLHENLWNETGLQEIILAFDFLNLREHPIAVTLKNLMAYS